MDLVLELLVAALPVVVHAAERCLVRGPVRHQVYLERLRDVLQVLPCPGREDHGRFGRVRAVRVHAAILDHRQAVVGRDRNDGKRAVAVLQLVVLRWYGGGVTRR